MPVWAWGLAPEKKINFALKNYAILSKFWYFFPILQHKNLPAHQRKWGVGIIPSPKSRDLSPVLPPAPTPMIRTSDVSFNYNKNENLR